jgi:hypothetical protein
MTMSHSEDKRLEINVSNRRGGHSDPSLYENHHLIKLHY